MQHYTQYFDYHLDLLNKFRGKIQTHSPYSNKLLELSESDREFMDTLDSLCRSNHFNESLAEKGQWLVARIVGAYSHLMPLLPRDILWFFGGDCLHYMPDEEIQLYQQLDELRFAAEDQQRPFDLAEAKSYLQENTIT